MKKRKKAGKRKKKVVREKGIKEEKIILPTHFEIWKSIRKPPVPPSQQHTPKKGKGSYRRGRNKKHKKNEEE